MSLVLVESLDSAASTPVKGCASTVIINAHMNTAIKRVKANVRLFLVLKFISFSFREKLFSVFHRVIMGYGEGYRRFQEPPVHHP
jgi:hypothetical protein